MTQPAATHAETQLENLRHKIITRTARVGVVGLGYVGLPLAVEFAKAGFSVTGIDLIESKIARINAGDSYIQDIPSAELKTWLRKGGSKPLRTSVSFANWTLSIFVFPRRSERRKIRT